MKDLTEKERAVGSVLTALKLKGAYGGHVIGVWGGSRLKEKGERKKGAQQRYEVVKALGTMDEFCKDRDAKYTIQVTDLIENAFMNIGELADEMRQWHDSMPDNLRDNSSKGEEVGQAADDLEGIQDALDMDCLTDGVEEGEELRAVSLPDLSGSTSRASRRDQAVSELQAAKEAIDELVEIINGGSRPFKSDKTDDDATIRVQSLEQLSSDLDEAISTAENVEFPGMFG